MGMAGFPRRYYAYSAFQFTGDPIFIDLSQFITYAAIFGALGQFIFLFNLLYSIRKGAPAPANPWKSNTLEWTTPQFPGHGNWPGDIPAVYRWPYDYSRPGIKEDYLPMHIPDDDPDWFESEPGLNPSPKRKVETVPDEQHAH
jgi:cytochrome c oxidase subunit 1